MTSEESYFLENIYKSYSEYLYKLIFCRVKNEEMAKDILQEVFLIAASKISVLYKHSNKRAWLISVANNKIKQYTSSNFIHMDNKRIKVFNYFDKKISDILERISITDTYFDDIDKKEFIKKFSNVLNEKEELYFKYKYIDNMSNQEIASELKISYAYAAVLGSRMVKKIKKFYKSNGKV